MRIVQVLVSASILAGCGGSLIDAAPLIDESEAGHVLDVGDVIDVPIADGEIRLRVARDGRYILTLVSTAPELGTSYGYGARAQKSGGHEPPDPLPPRPPPSSGPGKIGEGEIRQFDVFNGSSIVTIDAEVIRVSDRVVLWEDKTTPSDIEINYARVDLVLDKLESIVLPRQERIFGRLSDVDGDGYLSVLLSYTVNQYGPVAYVSGCDIGAHQACGDAPVIGEVIYLSIPDPESAYASANAITEVVAHELNHLIYAYHKYILNRLYSAEENIYLTEGMSALAQDLSGYNNCNQYVWGAAFDMSEFYESELFSVQSLSINDMFSGSGYYSEERDGALRGGAYLFLRYLFEQAGGMDYAPDGTLLDRGGLSWARDFFSSFELGTDAIEHSSERPLWDLALDFYTAMVVSGRGINFDPRFNFHPRIEDPITGFLGGVDPYANIHGWLDLSGPLVQPWLEADRYIRAGGAEFLQIDAKAGELSLWVDSQARVRARLLRIE